MDKDNQLLLRGAVDVIVRQQLEAKLKAGQPLKIKYGIDPTADRIHIGRAATLRHLKYFQDLGHVIQIVIGSFTGQIGDSSDKDSERPMISAEQIKANFKTYKKQLGKIFDVEKIEIYYNHEWFEQMKLDEFFKLQNMFSVAQMIERDNFAKRFKAQKRIGLHEFSYALLQGYDSVAMKSDVEIGGTDQLFNLLAGRTVQKNYNQSPQDIVTYELLLGTDGRKMSTTWDNCIFIDDEPNDMYGKVMSIDDNLMWDYFRLVTELSDEELEDIKRRLAGKKEQRELKGRLAFEITKLYHDEDIAKTAEAEFVKRFGQNGHVSELASYVVKVELSNLNIINALVESNLATSKSEARRLIDQKGIRVNSQTVKGYDLVLKNDDLVEVGKLRAIKVQSKT